MTETSRSPPRSLLLLLLLLLPSLHAMTATSQPIQCTAGTEVSGSGTTANWPTYHFMNNITRNASGALFMEPLNDANAIAEYRGLFHVMMQEGGGNWSHGVSEDMVRWHLIEDALDSGPKGIGFPDINPCDGALSFPDLGEAPYDGSTPVIVYDAACGVPLAPNHSISGMARSGGGGRVSGARAPIEDDVDRLEVARPSDPSDPYLRSWTKTLPGQATLSSPFFPSLPFPSFLRR